MEIIRANLTAQTRSTSTYIRFPLHSSAQVHLPGLDSSTQRVTNWSLNPMMAMLFTRKERGRAGEGQIGGDETHKKTLPAFLK